MKMGRIAPQPGPKHFETGDRLLAFCNSHGIAMRGHCLIWNEWVPAWIKNDVGRGATELFRCLYR